MRRNATLSMIPLALTALLALTSCAPANPVDVAPSGSTAPDPATTSAAPESAAPVESAAPSTDGVTLTYFAPNLGDCVIQSFNDNLVYQKVMEITGVNIQFQHATQGQEKEQIGVMIASRDLPDIVEIDLGGYSYPSGWEAFVTDGFAVQLNDLAATSAPNYLKVLESDKEIARQCTTDSGMLWAFYCVQPNKEPAWRGMALRKDLLDKAGRAVPETLGELKDTLLFYKNECGMSYPTPFKPTDGNMDDGQIVSAWNIGPQWYKDGNEYKYGPMQDAYKDYLTMMNDWYQAGLIDPESLSREGKDIEAMTVNGQYGLSLGYFGGYGPNYRCDTSGKAVDPDFDLYPIPNLPLNKGDAVHFKNINNICKGNPTIISTTCKNPEAAAKFLDYGYTQEGFELYNYGVEGVSYNKVNGEYVWTDLITKSEEGSWVNIREKYKRHQGPTLRDAMAFPISEYERRCMDQWDIPDDTLNPVPITRNAEESKRFNEIMTDVNTYRAEIIWKFITGDEPLSNFDAFRDQLRSMGIEDAIKIQNDAFQRYMNREL